jgi:hypothetical protein
MSNSPFKPDTLAHVLWHALAFAMRDLRLGRYPAGLTEDQRFDLARQTILRLRQKDQWKLLDEVTEPLPVTDSARAARPR